jgi:hypothetical protein
MMLCAWICLAWPVLAVHTYQGDSCSRSRSRQSQVRALKQCNCAAHPHPHPTCPRPAPTPLPYHPHPASPLTHSRPSSAHKGLQRSRAYYAALMSIRARSASSQRGVVQPVQVAALDAVQRLRVVPVCCPTSGRRMCGQALLYDDVSCGLPPPGASQACCA